MGLGHMPYQQQVGNTAVEYTLLAAFVAFTAIISLSTMGNSVSELLAQPAKEASKTVVEDMVSMNFSVNASSNTNQSNILEQNQKSYPPEEAMNISQNDAVNASSSDGKTIMAMIQATFNRVSTMQDRAKQTEENELADWYRETSRYAYRLAGSQATFSYYENPIANNGLKPLLEPNLNKGDAIRSMYEMKKEIGKKVAQISKSTSISEEGKQEAVILANQILSSLNKQYGATLAKYSDSQNNLMLSEIKRDFGGGERQYQRENLKPVAAQLLRQGSARESIALEASLQNGIVMETKASQTTPE